MTRPSACMRCRTGSCTRRQTSTRADKDQRAGSAERRRAAQAGGQPAPALGQRAPHKRRSAFRRTAPLAGTTRAAARSLCTIRAPSRRPLPWRRPPSYSRRRCPLPRPLPRPLPHPLPRSRPRCQTRRAFHPGSTPPCGCPPRGRTNSMKVVRRGELRLRIQASPRARIHRCPGPRQHPRALRLGYPPASASPSTHCPCRPQRAQSQHALLHKHPGFPACDVDDIAFVLFRKTGR
jgi:hypothetical protein